ncbi:Pyruvate/Phosphoenolpyruvate kinase-like domain-containing protein [Mycena albidolilacea]|uniref:Pyruvate/Phosphoenolpyruvate kinase-like domain-containing protein n=1 Tax=Mycena albidolilacea TaxID=1033008 RepID=A0AAD7EJ31_9AGAR|nr:Pyruvate/Phosphoenolpyruvate kinase-like domain-containing protein [Mycena albidolilacea]
MPPPSTPSWAAPTLQQPSNLRARLKNGQLLVGVGLAYPSVHVAKTLAVTGADWCWIDAEHVAWSPSLLTQVIQVIIHESGGRTIPVVRVPSKTAFDYMAWCLDAGAGGIIVPHIETEEEVAAVVAACRFPPLGHRSYSPFFLPGVMDKTPPGETTYSIANKHVAVIPQIESRLGIANLDAIMRNPQVDGVVIGAGDLRLDMGLPISLNGTETAYAAALLRVFSLAKQYNMPLICLALGAKQIEARLAEGFTVLVVSLDLHALAFAVMRELEKARKVDEGLQRTRSGDEVRVISKL